MDPKEHATATGEVGESLGDGLAGSSLGRGGITGEGLGAPLGAEALLGAGDSLGTGETTAEGVGAPLEDAVPGALLGAGVVGDSLGEGGAIAEEV